MRSEQFKLELHLKLRQPLDEKVDEQARMRELARMERRVEMLQILADDLRRKAVALESELAVKETDKQMSAGERKGVAGVRGAAGVHGAEGELRKRMLGTWRLVSFADGRVSNANVGS